MFLHVKTILICHFTALLSIYSCLQINKKYIASSYMYYLVPESNIDFYWTLMPFLNIHLCNVEILVHSDVIKLIIYRIFKLAFSDAESDLTSLLQTTVFIGSGDFTVNTWKLVLFGGKSKRRGKLWNLPYYMFADSFHKHTKKGIWVVSKRLSYRLAS